MFKQSREIATAYGIPFIVADAFLLAFWLIHHHKNGNSTEYAILGVNDYAAVFEQMAAIALGFTDATEVL